MAEIGNPFLTVVPRQFSPMETQQAIRLDIADEMEAIINYEAHAQATDDARVRKVMQHIADEERQHVGELQQLLYMLNMSEQQETEKGKQAIVQQQQSNFQAPLQ